MGTPLVWSLTVAVVVVAIFALLACNHGIGKVQKSFEYYKLKITWLRAMFDVHMCGFFFFSISCRQTHLFDGRMSTHKVVCLSLEGNLEWFSGGKLPNVTRTNLLVEVSLCLSIFPH